MIFAYAFRKICLITATSLRIFFAEWSNCFRVQISDIGSVHRCHSSISFSPTTSVFLVAKIEVSASAWPDADGKEEVYVVNLES